MPQSIQDLRELRSTQATEARNLLDTISAEDWNDEHNKQYDELTAKISSTDDQINRHQKQLDIDAATRQSIHDRAERGEMSTDEAEHQAGQEKEIFLSYLRGGINSLTTEQRQQVSARAREVRNTMSTGTGSEGGYLVPREFASTMLEALKAYGGIRSVATIIQTDSGAGMDWPTTDATSEEGELVGENTEVAVASAVFGTKPLETYKFSSKSIAVPFELLQDSAIDLEAHLRERLMTRLGRITNRMYATGTGTSQPGGLVTRAAAGKIGASGQTTSLTWEDLVDLKHSVDPAYRGNAVWSFHDQTLREIKKLKDGQSRPLWVPGIAMAEPDTIDGDAYVINQNIPVMAASAKSVLYGDHARYVIRDVMTFMLFRMTDSKYTELGQVGFLAFMRSGGDLMDVGGAVKAYQNAAT